MTREEIDRHLGELRKKYLGYSEEELELMLALTTPDSCISIRGRTAAVTRLDGEEIA